MSNPQATRYTVSTLRSGQPRPYADTEHVYRVLIESTPFGNGQWSTEFTPLDVGENWARAICKDLCHWVDNGEWHETRLAYMKKLDKGLYEVKTTQAFTD